MKTIGTLSALTVAASCLVAWSPVSAQATRTWVSGVGDDVNPCSRTAPCKTFAGAISKTAAGGEINCLDPGGFGAVTITKAMTISCLYTEGGALAGGNGIVVNAGANDVVYIRGLDLFGVNPPANGIRFLAGAALHLDDVVIRRFNATNSFGVSFVPSGASKLFIVNSRISDNGGANTGGGINIDPGAAGSARVFIIGSVISNNVGSGILASDSTTVIQVTNSAIIGNGAGLLATGNASINSSGDNVLLGNSNDGSFKAIITKK
jgi:hypothetical protein